MSKRPPNELESKLHQAALAAPNKELTGKQAEAIVPDPAARQNALNFLLGVGLFKSLADSKGTILFRAVTKGELAATRDLSGEENLVLGHIKASRTEGIWTKHLKAKTNLHQTVIDRCLKTLVQKRLIKRVQSVQHPTRKIYMLEGLEPSVILTGGPWYTDNELDVEFIQHLKDACLKFIRDVTFPKRRNGSETALYALSNSPQYPSAQQIRNSLKRARLTETELSVEHVEMLLNVLILDGEIEKIPAFGTSLWDAGTVADDDSEDDSDRKSKKKKKRKDRSDEEEVADKKKRRKRKDASEESSSSDEDSGHTSKRKRTKSKSISDDDESDDGESRKKKKKSRHSPDESSSDDEERRSAAKRHKKKSRSSDSDSSDQESDHKSHRRKIKSKSIKRSSSPTDGFDNFGESGGFVYRAIKQECLTLGWSESPCCLCPSFEFCKDGGPVNPSECVYYGDWLLGGTVSAIEDSR